MDTKALNFFFITFFLLMDVRGQEWESYPVLAHYLKSHDISSIAPLRGGKSYDQVFKLKTKNETWVLRLLNLKRSFEKRRLICTTTSLIGKKGLGPRVVWYDPSYQFLITEFIEGRYLTSQDLQDPVVFTQMVVLLRSAHQELTHLSSSLQPYFLKDRVLQRLKEVSIFFSNLKFIMSLKANIERVILAKPYGLSHGDVKGANILKTSKDLFLIDWGEVGPSSLYDDLGSLAFHFSLTPVQEEKLLNLYFGQPLGENALKILKVHRWLAELHHRLWQIREKEETARQFRIGSK